MSDTWYAPDPADATQDQTPDDGGGAAYPRSPTSQPYRGPVRVRRSDGQREYWVEHQGYVPENSLYRLPPQDRVAVQTARTRSGAAREALPLLGRFEELNRTNPTGAVPQIIGQALHIPQLLGDSGIDEMNSITDKLTPMARGGLPGSASNLDVQMFRGALPSIQHIGPSNTNIINDLRGQARQAQAYSEFLDWYWPHHGASINGAQEAWGRYVAENPQLQTPWRQYFRIDGGGAPSTASSAPPAAAETAHLSSAQLAAIARGGN